MDAPEEGESTQQRSDLTLLLAYLRPERRALALLTLLLLVTMGLPVLAPVLLGQIVDGALAGLPTQDLLALVATFLLITLTADSLQLVVTYWSVKLAWRVGNAIRLDLAGHTLALDLTWHGSHSPGLLIERIDGDIDAVVTFASTAVLNLLGNAILLTGTLVAALIINVRAGALIAVVTIVAGLILARLRRVAVPAYDAEREIQAQMYADLEERLGGLEDIRANGAAAYVVHRLQATQSRWWDTARRASVRGESAYAAAAGAFTLGSVLTLGLAIYLNRQGQLTLGSTLALFRFAQMVRQPLEAIAEQITEFQRALAGSTRAARLLATEPRLTDGPGADLPSGALAVDFRDVHFAYPDEPDRPVLSGVDLHLAEGTILGVVGRTGSGKTSLGRLLLRFWDVTGGSVAIGGVDVREFTQAQLRRRVGVVTQEVQILRQTLRENLTLLGAGPATDDDLRQVIVAVGLAEWFAGLGEDLDAVVDGSAALSAGEAQLLAFARILLTDPGIVVLDEATSRLDPETEELVTRAADRALAGRTVVIIAHRLATLDRADRIAVVDQGRIVESGRRADLAGDPSSRFARLQAQLALPGAAAEVPRGE
ncbi:ABC transporter ATP-binding protein [Euzebya tangerina]|uniref:ABC transporter ATP-binding protein n=1 Tax=Euzebya tangerina TaxID=591198 RepID=UPI000E31819F|nr:ABC transporter ATP-binding protein [Euzebya tangerina]